jgi:hypothetical protein
MINFRFHIVSLIAVFLALAVGIVMGSTVINTAIVDGLRREIRRVEKSSDDQRAENADLGDQNQRLQSFVDDSAAATVAGALTDRPIATTALRGTDEDTVKQQVQLLQAAGANTNGIVWLEDKWDLATPDQVNALRQATGSTARGTSALRADAQRALAQRLTTGPVPGQPDVLSALIAAGFVTLEPVGDGSVLTAATLPGSDSVLLLGGPTATVTTRPLARDLARALLASGASPTVGEVFKQSDGGPDRGAWLKPVLNDAQLSGKVSTVDDIDLTQGRVAATLALADLARGAFGKYGYGADADSSIPARVS